MEGTCSHGGYAFVFGQRQEIDDVKPLGGSAALGHLICLETVDPAEVGEEKHILVRGAGEHIFGKIVVLFGKSRNALPPAVLQTVGVGGKPLDIAVVGEGENAVLIGNEVLDVNLSRNHGDFGASVVDIAVADGIGLVLDDLSDFVSVAENSLKLGNLGVKGVELVLDFDFFKTGETSQRHLNNGGGLNVVKAEPLGQRRLGIGNGLGAADYADDLVDKVNGGF